MGFERYALGTCTTGRLPTISTAVWTLAKSLCTHCVRITFYTIYETACSVTYVLAICALGVHAAQLPDHHRRVQTSACGAWPWPSSALRRAYAPGDTECIMFRGSPDRRDRRLLPLTGDGCIPINYVAISSPPVQSPGQAHEEMANPRTDAEGTVSSRNRSPARVRPCPGRTYCKCHDLC